MGQLAVLIKSLTTTENKQQRNIVVGMSKVHSSEWK